MAERRPVEQIELPARLEGGSRYWQINAKPVFDSSGDFIGYRGFGRDVTAHRRTARHLIRAKEEAERASSDKSHFLAMMSHELRTPLNAIIGFSEILAEEREGPLGNPAYRDYAGDIRDSSRHLAALIGDVIEFARVEHAEIKLFEQPLDPAELLEACVKMCRPEARSKNIAIGELVDVSGIELTGDLTRLKQVLVNLLNNAVKFTRQGEAWRRGSAEASTAISSSGSPTAGSASSGGISGGSSSPSSRAMPALPAGLAVSGSASPSRASWRGSMAAMSGSSRKREWGRRRDSGCRPHG
jgi:signal transduction histidine kinase